MGPEARENEMNLNIEDFLTDLALEQERYDRIVEVTEEQKRVITTSDMDALLRLLQRKNHLLQEIEEIEKRTRPAKETWKTSRESWESGTMRRVEEAFTRIQEVLKRLLALEEEARDLMEKQKGTTVAQIREVQRKKKVLDAYGRGKPPESRFYDQSR